MTGRCSGKNVNFGSEKLLIKYCEKCIMKNNETCFIKSKVSYSFEWLWKNSCFTLQTLETFLSPRALILHTPSPLETCFYYHIFHPCLPSYYDSNCWISHYRKPAFHKYYMWVLLADTVSVFKEIWKFCNLRWFIIYLFYKFNEYKCLLFIKNRTTKILI